MQFAAIVFYSSDFITTQIKCLKTNCIRNFYRQCCDLFFDLNNLT